MRTSLTILQIIHSAYPVALGALPPLPLARQQLRLRHRQLLLLHRRHPLPVRRREPNSNILASINLEQNLDKTWSQ